MIGLVGCDLLHALCDRLQSEGKGVLCVHYSSLVHVTVTVRTEYTNV